MGSLVIHVVRGIAYPGREREDTEHIDGALTLPTNKSLMDVHVNCIYLTALVDTGAHVSVISVHLRRHLRKVLTPPATEAVRVVNDGTVPIIEMCMARISIADR